jgi:hypothetical protein
MEKYVFSVLLRVEVSAFTKDDAEEAVRDCLGEGDMPGLDVVDFEVFEYDRF